MIHKDIGELISFGRYSNVYKMKDNEEIVIKVINNKDYDKKEYFYNKKAEKLKIGPKIYKKRKLKDYTLLYIEKIDTILSEWLTNKHSKKEYDKTYNDILNLIRKLHKNNIVHGDIHVGNIGKIKNRWVLFDFGMTHKKDSPISKKSIDIERFITHRPYFSNKNYEEYLKKIIVPYDDIPVIVKVHLNIINKRNNTILSKKLNTET